MVELNNITQTDILFCLNELGTTSKEIANKLKE